MFHSFWLIFCIVLPGCYCDSMLSIFSHVVVFSGNLTTNSPQGFQEIIENNNTFVGFNFNSPLQFSFSLYTAEYVICKHHHVISFSFTTLGSERFLVYSGYLNWINSSCGVGWCLIESNGTMRRPRNFPVLLGEVEAQLLNDVINEIVMNRNYWQ